MKTLPLFLTISLFLTGGCAFFESAPAPLPETVPGYRITPEAARAALSENTKADLLSRHDVTATFDGIVDQPCRFLTALCPDRCNHGGKVAVFTIDSYNTEPTPSQFIPEPKESKFHIRIATRQGERTVPDALYTTIDRLIPGDTVHLVWDHLYVSYTSGTTQPERPVLVLEKL